MKEIHAVDEDFIDEGDDAFDEYLDQLDADLAKEKADLPSAPLEAPTVSAASEVKHTEGSQERSAVLECDCLFNDYIEWVLSSAIHHDYTRSCYMTGAFLTKWPSIFIIRPISQRRFQRPITHSIRSLHS